MYSAGPIINLGTLLGSARAALLAPKPGQRHRTESKSAVVLAKVLMSCLRAHLLEDKEKPWCSSYRVLRIFLLKYSQFYHPGNHHFAGSFLTAEGL